MNRMVQTLALVAALVSPAHAQIVVTDPGNLAQATLIAERTLREYDALRALEDNDTPEHRARNRRVTIMILGEAPPADKG